MTSSQEAIVMHNFRTVLYNSYDITGMYRLEISHNPLSEIPDDAFYGLDRALWELRLHDNELIDVPSKALRHLQKLRLLDLSSNNIGCIELDSFRGLEESLAILSLADNSINALKPDSFMGLSSLESLDVSGNNLGHIDNNLFRDGMPKLAKVVINTTCICANDSETFNYSNSFHWPIICYSKYHTWHWDHCVHSDIWIYRII